MGSEKGGKFSVLIRVSFANACVSKDYANGEWFGFDSIEPTIFVVYAILRFSERFITELGVF